MSDTAAFHAILRDREHHGYHSHEARRNGTSGNPAQRAKDLVTQGVAVCKRREWDNGRNGCRYWLAEYAPLGAEPVRANGADVGGGGPEVSSPMHTGPVPAVDLSTERTPAKRAPAASSVPSEPLAWYRDYDRDPHGPWRRIPLSEVMTA